MDLLNSSSRIVGFIDIEVLCWNPNKKRVGEISTRRMQKNMLCAFLHCEFPMACMYPQSLEGIFHFCLKDLKRAWATSKGHSPNKYGSLNS